VEGYRRIARYGLWVKEQAQTCISVRGANMAESLHLAWRQEKGANIKACAGAGMSKMLASRTALGGSVRCRVLRARGSENRRDIRICATNNCLKEGGRAWC